MVNFFLLDSTKLNIKNINNTYSQKYTKGGTWLILNEKYDKQYVQNDFLSTFTVFLGDRIVRTYYIAILTIKIFGYTKRPYLRIIEIFCTIVL